MKPFYIFIFSAFTVVIGYFVHEHFEKMQKSEDEYILFLKCKGEISYDARCEEILAAESKKDEIN